MTGSRRGHINGGPLSFFNPKCRGCCGGLSINTPAHAIVDTLGRRAVQLSFISRLPDASVDCTKIKCSGVAWNTGHGNHSASTEWPN